MQVLAPAKVNLSLRVLGRRGDGFHEIETLIAPISLYDKIDIERQPRWIDFNCNDPSIPRGDENLIIRAARKFLEATRIKTGLCIRLAKKIPQGAGLGGGSSDAAATLLGLNRLFESKLSREALANIGATIGSDVPFFIFQSAALCRGRGEVVRPIQLEGELSILLFKPAFTVSTAWAYSRWKASRELPNIRYTAQELGGRTFVNHLERPVFEKYVFLAKVKSWLLEQPAVLAGLMSGSGSTVFAILGDNADSEALAKRAREKLDREMWTCAARTL
jgi:4-diphosphocytidyl-2-C-methyl-D-erythritol kinase